MLGIKSGRRKPKKSSRAETLLTLRKATNATVTPRILLHFDRDGSRLLRGLVLPRLGPQSRWRGGSPGAGLHVI